MTDTMYLYAACVLGILARAALPYLVVLKENPETKFDRKFLTSPIAALVLDLLVAPFVLGEMPAGLDWIAAFTFGWASSDISRKILKLTPLR